MGTVSWLAPLILDWNSLLKGVNCLSFSSDGFAGKCPQEMHPSIVALVRSRAVEFALER